MLLLTNFFKFSNEVILSFARVRILSFKYNWDEVKDYRAAVGSGIHPFMVSYGFEDFERLTVRHGIPEELISRSPEELEARVLHALGLALR